MCTESSHGGDLMEPGHLVVALEAQRAAGVLGVNDVHKLGPENVFMYSLLQKSLSDLNYTTVISC